MYPNDEIHGVFFDLDGTLLDTAEDLAIATNNVLTYHGKKTIPTDKIRSLISGGTPLIIKNTFHISTNHPQYKKIQHEILQSYQQNMAANTKLFPGMETVLDFLALQNIKWGIITNKPHWLAEPLIKRLNQELKHFCLIGRETLPYIKPHPLPLIHACCLTGVAPQKSVYIGDSKSDIIAAKLAKMHSIAAAYGYIGTNDNVKNWAADYIIQSPYDLINWLRRRVLLRKCGNS